MNRQISVQVELTLNIDRRITDSEADDLADDVQSSIETGQMIDWCRIGAEVVGLTEILTDQEQADDATAAARERGAT
jgi:hypothetical protein